VALVLASAASYGVSAAVLLTLPAGSASPASQPGAARSAGVLHDVRYLTVCGLNGLLMTYGAILTVALPLWIVRDTRAPAWTVGGLFVLNTLLAVLLQVRASGGADTVPGAARAVLRSGVLLLLACVVFAGSRAFTGTGLLGAPGAVLALMAGIALLTAGEVLQSAGGWGLSYALAPEHQQGQYLGAFTMGTRVYDTAGPLLAAGLILGLGVFGWLLFGLLLLGLAAALAAAASWARRGISARPQPALPSSGA
jgi:hypothetical protein